MAFTYDPTTSRGRVRLLVSDTDTSDATKQIFTDAEIDALLSLGDNEVFQSAALACRSLAASSSKSAIAWRALSMSSIDRTKIPDHYLKIAASLDAKSLEPSENIDSVDSVIGFWGDDQSEYNGELAL